MYQNVTEKVWWPGIGRFIEERIQGFRPCQATLPAIPRREILKPTKIPMKPWDTLAIDIQGPYPTGDNLFVKIDYRSRYPTVTRMKEVTTEKITESLDHNFSIHGYPEVIVSDNGPPVQKF